MDKRLDRRLFLASIASAGALAACSDSSKMFVAGGAASDAMARPGSPHLKLKTIPMDIINQTGQDKLFIYLKGTTDRTHEANNVYHLTNVDGDLELIKPSDNDVTFSFPIEGEKTTIQLPRLQGIRLYVSFGEGVYVHVGENGIPSSPPGFDKNYKSYNTLFDFVELDYAEDPNAPDHEEVLGGNSTQVDGFALAFALSLTGKLPDGKIGTLSDGLGVAGARDKILEEIGKTKDFEQLVVKGGPTGTLRAIAPALASSLRPTPLFPADYYTAYIDQVWEKYKTTKMLLSAENNDYVGQVTAQDILEFIGPKASFSFKKPTTEAVLRASPPLESKGGVQGIAVTAISAAFNRSTLLVNDNLNACDEKEYYKNPVTNHYSAIMHKYGAGGTAYGFGFDDWCSKSSFISVRSPVKASLTILPF
jgi:hypothetical protein